MALRYYLYISDAKVDMLLPQVDPAFARRRTTEVGVNLQFASAKRNVEAQAADRVVRLERVVRHVDDFCDVGTVDEPGQYFRGRLPMRWGPLALEPSFVYFGGRTGHTIVGLGGSSGHVLGTSAPTEQHWTFAPSTLAGIIGALTAVVASDGEKVPVRAVTAVHMANRAVRGVEQEVEFVAKRLLHEPSPYPELDDDMMVLLGSPLFVALAD